jgi:hypothetical protein
MVWDGGGVVVVIVILKTLGMVISTGEDLEENDNRQRGRCETWGYELHVA